MWDAFFGRSVTPRYYRPLADVSPATATNDLAAAVAAGLLRPEGKARSREYGAGDALYTRIGKALGIDLDEAGAPARGAHHWRAHPQNREMTSLTASAACPTVVAHEVLGHAAVAP